MRKLYQTRGRARKNFLPTLIITALLWISLGVMILILDPEISFAVPLFLFTSFMAFLFTFSIILVNTRRGALVACVLVAFMVLKILGVDNIFNFILVLVLAIIIDRLSGR